MDAPELTTILDLVRWIGWAQRKAGEDWIRSREVSHEQAFVLGYLTQNPGAIQRDAVFSPTGGYEQRQLQLGVRVTF